MPSFNPNIGREYPSSKIDRVGDNAIFETFDHGVFNLTQAVISAVHIGSSEAIQRFRAFAEGLATLEHSSRSQLAATHFQVAKEMQDATIRAYRSAHARGRRNSPYRLSARDAGGRMLAVLENPLFVRGSHSGIGFANVTLMNAEARQWHRLNFGALGSRGGGAITKAHSATWDGLLIGAFGFTDESSSAGFVMPRGIWISEGGKSKRPGDGRRDQFHVTGSGNHGLLGRFDSRKPTAGIKAWNFFDAGVVALAENIGPAYGNLYSNWCNSAARGVGPLSKQINIPAPRRTPLSLP